MTDSQDTLSNPGDDDLLDLIEEDADALAQGADLPPWRVLVVDDEPAVRVTTSPRCRARNSTSTYSRAVSVTGWPSLLTVRAAVFGSSELLL